MLSAPAMAEAPAGTPIPAQATPQAQAAPPPQAQAAPQPPAPGGLPPVDVLVSLIRSTLLAVNQGNQTGSYAELHAQLTPEVQKSVDAARIAQALSTFRQNQVDLSTVGKMPPRFLKNPQLDPRGVLILSGLFPTQPRVIRFNLAYRQIDGKWRLDNFNVDTPNEQEVAASQRKPVQATTTAQAAPQTGPAPAAAANQSAPPNQPVPRPPQQGPVSSQPSAQLLDHSTDPPTTTHW